MDETFAKPFHPNGAETSFRKLCSDAPPVTVNETPEHAPLRHVLAMLRVWTKLLAAFHKKQKNEGEDTQNRRLVRSNKSKRLILVHSQNSIQRMKEVARKCTKGRRLGCLQGRKEDLVHFLSELEEHETANTNLSFSWEDMEKALGEQIIIFEQQLFIRLSPTGAPYSLFKHIEICIGSIS